MENRKSSGITVLVTLIAMLIGMFSGAFGMFYILPEETGGPSWIMGLWVGLAGAICALAVGGIALLLVNAASLEGYSEPVSLWRHYTPWERRLEVGSWIMALVVFGSIAWRLDFEPMIAFMVACFTPPGIISIATDYRAKKRLAGAKKEEDIPKKPQDGDA